MCTVKTDLTMSFSQANISTIVSYVRHFFFLLNRLIVDIVTNIRDNMYRNLRVNKLLLLLLLQYNPLDTISHTGTWPNKYETLC